jgi:hypothetical protein
MQSACCLTSGGSLGLSLVSVRLLMTALSFQDWEPSVIPERFKLFIAIAAMIQLVHVDVKIGILQER